MWFVRELNTYYMYMKGWYYMYKERSWPLVIILSLGQRRDLVMPLGRSLWFLPYAYVYRLSVWSGKGSCNPAVRAVGKSEVEIEIVYWYFSFGEKGEIMFMIKWQQLKMLRCYAQRKVRLNTIMLFWILCKTELMICYNSKALWNVKI